MPDSDHKQALPPGHQLGHYRLLDVLGVGGFGVTYLGEHVSLGHRVAVKEYLPNEFAVREGATVHPKSPADREDFEWGLTRFVDEARTLTRFRHPNLVRVSDYFEANSTAYIVMDYEDGEPLDALLERHGTLTEAQLKRVLLPVADGLRQVHAAGFLHRDIKPSNIFVRRSDETPVLLDFGAARQALGRKSKSMTAIASAGYSPPEQYESQGAQGAWTDVYALAALCHRAVTGKAPMEAPRRQGQLLRSQVDPLPRLAETGAPDYSQAFLEAVDWGLRVIETERPQSLDEWLAQLEDAEAEPAEKPETSARSKRKKAVGPKPPQPTARSAGRQADRPKPPETSARPAARFGAQAAWLGGAAAAIGVALYFALAYWPQGSGQDQGPTLESPPATQPRRGDGAGDGRAQPGASPSAGTEPAPRRPDEELVGGGSALLVVETKPAGVEVLVGDQSVGETPLELANLRAGAHDLTLRHPHYETIRLEDQEFTDGKVLRVERTLTRGVGELTVLTTPRNAWVERDGERLASRTPVTLEGLPAGALQLTLGADGHRTAQVRAEVPKDGLGRLQRTLEPIVYGTLTLELVPADAAVTLPDIGPPYRPGMRLPEGRHRVVAKREGYADASLEVAVPGNGEARERIELSPLPQPFTVAATPSNADVEILGAAEAYRAGMPLAPGDYRVRVSAPRYEAKEELVRHGMGPTRHAVALAKVRQPFTVEASPATAQVRLVDRSEGYRAGMLLPWGEHRVEVSATGYQSKTETVRHGSSGPTTHRVDLEKLFEVGRRFRDCPDCPELVVVPSGSFMMGSPSHEQGPDEDEGPVHRVRIGEPFAVGVYEVTVSEFGRFAEGTGHSTGNSCWTYEGGEWKSREGFGWRDPGFRQAGSHPVVCVSWDDARAYATWLSRRTGERYRLLSESEWEYVARAGTRTARYWGEGESGQCGHANGADASTSFSWAIGCGDGHSHTAPVGSYGANAWGLHDVLGNVWEWTADCWNDSYAGAPSNGSAWESRNCSNRVLRGGSWLDVPGNLRSADRYGSVSGFRIGSIGFRVARTLTP